MKKAGPVAIILVALALAGTIIIDLYKSGSRQTNGYAQPGNNKTTGNDALNLVLVRDNFLFVYQGADLEKGHALNPAQLPGYITTWKHQYPTSGTVMVKPAPGTTDHYLVNVVGDITACNIQRYAIVELSNRERQLIDSLNH